MFELLYTSISEVPLTKKQCKDLLGQSQRNNHLNDITGIILFDGYLFLHLLEGEKDKVLNLFDKIKDDPRHTEVDCLYYGDIAERSYGDWSMGYHYIEDGLIDQVSKRQIEEILSPKQNFLNYGARLHSMLLRRYNHLIRQSA